MVLMNCDAQIRKMANVKVGVTVDRHFAINRIVVAVANKRISVSFLGAFCV